MLRGAALLLLALLCGQAAASPIKLVKLKSAMLGDALGGMAVHDDSMHVPANFTEGKCWGNGFCFPRFNAAVKEKPVMVCPEGATLNSTLGKLTCLQQRVVKTQSCVRGMRSCPAGFEELEDDKLCLPKEVRSSMIGMLAVFKVKAQLPFTIVPTLKSALADAAANGVHGPNITLLANMSRPHITLPAFPDVSISVNKTAFNPLTVTKNPLLLVKAAGELSQAGQEVVHAMVGGVDPMDLLRRAFANLNVSEVMDVVPEINAWVSKCLDGVTNINNITAEVSSHFPDDCLLKCCKPGSVSETLISLPTPTCGNATALSPKLGLCVSAEAGFSPCPGKFRECQLPAGKRVCVARKNMWGMDSCEVAGMLAHALPKHQCP